MMAPELEEEILYYVQQEVLMGFDTEEGIFESILDLFYGDGDIDHVWLKEQIADMYGQQQAESKTWEKPTDFDRLAAAFNNLIDQRIVCLHKAGDTLEDGESDCKELIAELKKKGIEVKGYCFYHTQDLQSAIDPQQRVLPLNFGSTTQQAADKITIGQSIVAALQQQGLDIAWNGTPGQQISIKHMYWRKTPGDIN